MKRVFSHILEKTYVTKASGTEVLKVKHNACKPNVHSSVSHSWAQIIGDEMQTSGRRRRQFSMAVTSGPMPPTPHLPPPNVTYFSPINIKPVSPSAPPPHDDEARPWNQEEEERVASRRQYLTLLNYAAGVVTRANSGFFPNKTSLMDELNVKRVLSKNEEMKKVIIKVAAAALQNEEEIHGNGSLHPFIATAGTVFFGETYDACDDVTGDEPPCQDLFTPGLLVLLFKELLLRENKTSHVAPSSNKHLLLAKALVETCAGYLLHRTVQDTDEFSCDNVLPERNAFYGKMHQGNKLATLTGDLLVVSLIKHVATTRNNKVLELVMNSLSDFSTTEISKSKAFEALESPDKTMARHRANIPSSLAESVVFTKGFQAVGLLLGKEDMETSTFSANLGSILGLLWKTNYDWMQLQQNKSVVVNVEELNAHLTQLRSAADELLLSKLSPQNDGVVGIMRSLVHFWGANKANNNVSNESHW